MNNLIRLYRDPAVVIDSPAAIDPPVVDPAPKSVEAKLDINKVDPPTPAAVDGLHDKAIIAVEEWQKNPTPELKQKAQDAVTAAKTAKAGLNLFTIPDTYKDKPYLKGVDSQEKLLAMLDGAQTLLGKKGPSIPAADAPQAEKDAYYEALGRPKTAAEYKIPGSDKADPAFLPKVQAVMHKHGLSQEQAAGVWTDINAGLQDWMKEKGLVEAQQDVDFNKLATDNFGAERDKVLARGKELISANISPTMKTAVEKLDNNALIVIADLMRNMDKKYIKPDGPPGGGPALNSGTPDELRAKARGLMSEQAKFDPLSVEFQNLQKQIDGIYDTIRKGTR